MQLNSVLRDWLHRRHITDAVIEKFGISGEHRIVIPVSTLFNKYRRHPLSDDGPKYSYDTGSKIALYGFDQLVAEPFTRVLVTEGEMDCLVAWSNNIPAVSSTGGALSFQKEWAVLFKNVETIVCFDNDPAGGEGMAKTLDMVPHAKMMFLPDRAGVSDISDYVQNGGDLHELIKTARSFGSLSDVYAHRSERQSTWQSTYFHDAYIKKHQEVERPVKMKKKSLGGDVILQAKEVPISDLIDFTHKKACCLWHSEKTPSMAYYPDTNSVYCFGCGRSGDSIDVVREQKSMSFTDAVNYLNGQ